MSPKKQIIKVRETRVDKIESLLSKCSFSSPFHGVTKVEVLNQNLLGE